MFTLQLSGLGPDFHPTRGGARQKVRALITGLPSADKASTTIIATVARQVAAMLYEIQQHPPARPPWAHQPGPAMTPSEQIRRRSLVAMSFAQIAALPDKARAVVVLTTGAIEQHGLHLPVAVDALMGQVWLGRALGRLPTDFPCYLAPPITIGRSVEHTGFPGTLSVSKETLRLQLLAIARQLNAWGFRRLAIHNTHGGNLAVLGYTLREIKAAFGLEACLLQPAWDFGLSAQEPTFGFHAGGLETSWILAAAGDLVDMAEARCEWPAQIDHPGVLRPEASPARFTWITRDLSESGVMGDATAATRENGERWLEHGADCLAAAIMAAAG